MTNRHRRTLERIHATPTPATIRWAEIEALMRAAGVAVVQRSGSRVAFTADTKSIVVHRPHPGSEVRRDAVRKIAEFLTDIGVVS